MRQTSTQLLRQTLTKAVALLQGAATTAVALLFAFLRTPPSTHLAVRHVLH